MIGPLKSHIESCISQYLGYEIVLSGESGIGGGCISSASVVQTDKGEKFFLKTNSSSISGMFRAEALGLEELYKAEAIKVPKVLGFADNDPKLGSFLLLEYIPSAKSSGDFFERFGEQFARLHQTTAKQFGFIEDNFIGSTPQANGWMDNWADFYRERRLGFQVALAKSNGLWDNGTDKLWNNMNHRLDELIGVPHEPPSLLHGDLWSGNYLADSGGEAWIIDPAVYYGSREADLAMTELFGGFSSQFYNAYRSIYPLQPGYKDRLKVYKLYHLLNHLNLFGSSYMSQVRSILQYFN